MDILSQGDGQLFTDPSANRARAFFAGKPRSLIDKLTTVADAVARLVGDGDYLAIGGFGSDRLPTAVLHEILRQSKRDLSMAGHTATHDFQILCAGNMTGRGKTLARVEIAYVVGLQDAPGMRRGPVHRMDQLCVGGSLQGGCHGAA